MSLISNDTYDNSIPVCEKHNFRGMLCLQCLHERTVSREDVEELFKFLRMSELKLTTDAKWALMKNDINKFHIKMGQRKTNILIQRKLKIILTKHSII